METWLSTSQAAELIGVHRTTVLNMIEEGLIEARIYTHGQRPRIRIAASEVYAYIERWTAPAASAQRSER